MKIGCSSYSLRNEWEKKFFFRDPDTWKRLKTQFPDIEGWELLSANVEQYLKDTELDDLKKLQSDINGAGFEWFAITLGSGVFIKNDVPHWETDKKYLEGFEKEKMWRTGFVEEWIENAAALGIKQMRVDCMPYEMNHKVPYSKAFDFNVQRNIDSYNEICEIAKEYEIEVGIENHGGFAGDYKVLRKLFEGAPDLKLTFDFGNVTDEDRIKMVTDFADRINFCHAKAHIFADDGEEAFIDFGEIIGVLKDKGFDGWMSIEWEGPKISQEEGTQKSMELLKKYL